jgi:hypothetical protein
MFLILIEERNIENIDDIIKAHIKNVQLYILIAGKAIIV